MHSNIVVESVVPSGVSSRDIEELNLLLKEFSPGAQELQMEEVREIAQDGVLFTARHERQGIVGMVTLIIYRKPTGLVGMVEDVIVTERFRGKGIGKRLMQMLLAVAHERQLKQLQLTSNPRRVAAHKLYRSLGFIVKDTTCFRLSLR